MKGLPDRVENINITTDSSSISLVWERPTSLAINTNFCVTVYNITGESTCGINTEILTEQCMLEDTRFTFVPSLGGAGAPEYSEYEFVVTAVTALGRGPASGCIFANFTHTGKFEL